MSYEVLLLDEPRMPRKTFKKLAAALAAVIVAAVSRWGLELDSQDVAILITPFVIYVYSQGRADQGKEAVRMKIEHELNSKDS